MKLAVQVVGGGIMNSVFANDFNLVESNSNGQFVRIGEINDMIKYGAIKIDREKMEEYKFDTTVIYNKDKNSREDVMKLWKQYK